MPPTMTYLLPPPRITLPFRAHPPLCSHRPPSKPPPRIRIPRKHTCHTPNWPWPGGTPTPPVSWRAFFNVEDSVAKVLEALWSKSRLVSESGLLARMTALGARVLRSFTDAIERSLYPSISTDRDFMVEYGVTEPNPADKTFVDPLRDWDTSKVTTYSDSFGRPVYLQLHGVVGLAAAAEFYDLYQDEGEEECADDTTPS